MITSYEINITPVAKGRPRMTRSGHVYTPRATKEYEDELRRVFLTPRETKTLDGALALDMEFYFEAPKTKPERIGKPHTKKPDIDNLVKSVMDAGNGILFGDDSYVAEITARKAYCKPGEYPRVKITIEKLEE